MTAPAASADLLRLLAALVEPPGPEHRPWAEALELGAPASLEAWRIAHTETFVTQCVPYASIYLGEQGAIGGEAADRVAGFRRLLGARIDGSPDALGALLGDYATLAERAGRDAQAAHARRALLWEHLLCWLPPYLDCMARSAPAPYRQWAELAQTIFHSEARLSGIPSQLPLHLRAAPPGIDIDAATCGIDEMAAALLVPIRSGLILSQRDLAGIAERLGVAVGFGSRRYILRDLLGAQPQACLHRLADEAQRQATDHANRGTIFGSIAEFWSQRAARTAAALIDTAEYTQEKSNRPATREIAK